MASRSIWTDGLLHFLCNNLMIDFKFLGVILEKRNYSLEEMEMLKEKVEEALDKVRPSLQADGGDVELVDVDEDGVVKVKLQGSCAGCPMSQMTLKMGIEKILKQNIPEISRVDSV